MIHAFDQLIAVARPVFLAVALFLAALSALDWLVRTRRLSPFGPVARFMRAWIDPVLKPVERRVVRAGGLPSNAPWWALGAVVIAGIVLLSLLAFAREQAAFLEMALQGGAGGVWRVLVSWTVAMLQVALLVRVISSWTGVSPYVWYIRWSYRLTDPLLAPLRRVIPSIGMVDVTPIVAWLLLGLIRTVLLSIG